MSVQDIKFTLPAKWQEASRNGNEKQVVIQLYHISPLAHIDPKLLQDQAISSNAVQSVSKLPVPVPSGTGAPAGEFFKAMQSFIDSGYAPAYMTTAYLDDLHKKMSTAPMAERPDESDLTANVSIVRYDTREMAKQAFENTVPMQTGALLDMPVVGGPKDSSGKTVSYMDFFKSPAFKQFLTPEQSENLKKMDKIIQEKKPEMQAEMKKSGVVHKQEKYLGYEAIYAEMPNPNPPPVKKAAVRKKENKFAGGGGYGNNAYAPLPKIAVPYSPKVKTYQAMLVNNCVVTGQLIGMAESLPPGNTPCYSFTKTEQKTEIVEGIKTVSIVPTVSTYSAEGYFHKEEVENVIKIILAAAAAL